MFAVSRHVPKPLIHFTQLTLVSLYCLAGCGDTSEQSSDSQEQFDLGAHDVSRLDAALSTGSDTVQLSAQAVSDQQFDISFSYPHSTIKMTIDHERGLGRFEPSGAPLDASDAALTDRLIAHLVQVIPEDESARTPLETALLRQASYMQIVPVGEQLSTFEFEAQRGWTLLSCTCGSQHLGDGVYRTAGRGCSCTGGSGNGCKGRCGQGCGITSVPPCTGTTVYTRDCAKHDYGLGSFSAASDDYVFAPNNCSCSGVGSCY